MNARFTFNNRTLKDGHLFCGLTSRSRSMLWRTSGSQESGFDGRSGYGYGKHAEKFAAQTEGADLGSIYDKFLHHVGAKGCILDAGCGVGRDTAIFIARGYQVVAFDGAEQLVRIARNRIGNRAPIHRLRFEDVLWKAEFDGIWACASLLHVPLASFADIVTRLAGALRTGGAFYMSFKLGEGERNSAGRLFVD